MKTQKNPKQPRRLTPDSQNRLLAYTTAAGLGAFLVSPSAEAQVTLSQGLAPYPHTLVPGTGAGYYHTYFYIDVDGNGTPDFNLGVSNWRIDIGLFGNRVLNPSVNSYVVPWTVGTTVNNTGSIPTYKRWLATPDFNNFASKEALGFSFTASDSLTHFGYMDLQINGSATGVGNGDFTVTVGGIYWDATPNAGITVQAVPEPSSLALLAAGIVGLAARRVRRERVK